MSCRAEASTRTMPKRNATTINQKVQRHRLSTPIPRSAMNAEIEIKKASSTKT